MKKIIEMDEEARKVEQQAKSEKLKSEAEVEKLREEIYNDFIAKAKDRVEKNIAVDEARAKEQLEAYEANINASKQKMHDMYDSNNEKWVDEIVKRALA